MDDCCANWGGFLLRAEWMAENDWWWCVYDLLNDEIQVASSNDQTGGCFTGEIARKEAEKAAKEYLRVEIFMQRDLENDNNAISKYISDLKILDARLFHVIKSLADKLNLDHLSARELLAESKEWEAELKASHQLTQHFLDVCAEDADEVKIEDGRVTSVTFNLKKEESERLPPIQTNSKPLTIWQRIKQRFTKKP